MQEFTGGFCDFRAPDKLGHTVSIVPNFHLLSKVTVIDIF